MAQARCSLTGVASVFLLAVASLCVVLRTNSGDNEERFLRLESRISVVNDELATAQKRLAKVEREVKSRISSGSSGSLQQEKFMQQEKSIPDEIRVDGGVVTTDARNIGTSLSSVEMLYTEFAEDLKALKQKVMRWANETDLHQGIGDVEAELIYLRLRKLRPAMVAELGFGQGLATRYFLQALEDNGHGHLYTFDLEDKWNRVRKMELTHRWTFTLGDARKTLDKFGPYQYVHSDCEHSTEFAKYVAGWLKSHRSRQGPILFSFHDVYKWLPNSPHATCEGGMHRSSSGITPEGQIMLDFAREVSLSPAKSAFSIAASHFSKNYEAVQGFRHSVELDDNWVADSEKYKDPNNYRKGNKKVKNMSPECKMLLKRTRLETTIFFEV